MCIATIHVRQSPTSILEEIGTCPTLKALTCYPTKLMDSQDEYAMQLSLDMDDSCRPVTELVRD